ncbi:ThiF family adenylyltransferase [Rhodopirellula sallentina]|uniref:UBA/THIF-type NAD/FAD binding fold domain protein n=1 Tax=Rhodopirellula sallentina SM41 TaxID=1263870 RepID=M5U5Y4_9BACT|nr:ThiF family adenylyltransferase [Rhodopirellula sallentina]EMI53256.1 UBA/THIF-type NAD/FAD binding fold domain protein [Rhodopirellula sallentina SM41]
MSTHSLDVFASPHASPVPVVVPTNGHPTGWTYEEAFGRNTGLISKEDQQKLRECRVAIPGMGGVGGVHLVTLARLGVGAFSIADRDEFSVANFNRQYGAKLQSVGARKAQTMAANARAINPDLDLSVISDRVTQDNVDQFLSEADVLIDGVDFFSIEARRMIFREARRRGIWAITAGPVGFSTAWLVFDPDGMSFDEYFDLNDDMSKVDQLLAFAVGLTPKATQTSYMDISKVDLKSGAAPSLGLACQLASGVATAELTKIVTGKGKILAAPHYQQFDTHQMKFVQGKLRFGNRGPIQKLKRRFLKTVCARNGII